MKQILPILTLTTLTAAAFADASAPAAAAPAGLSYNRVGLSYQTNQVDTTHPYTLSASAFIGGSNVLVSGSAVLNSGGADSASIGYVFKGVAAGIDATVSASSNDTYGINLRRSLGEVLSGLEVAVGYSSATGSTKNDSWTYELAYNITKQYSIAYSIQDVQGDAHSVNNVSLRYNF